MTRRFTTTLTQGLASMTHRFAASFILIAVAVSAVGCDTPQRITYTEPTPDDDAFAKGANRPPSADTLYRMAILLESQGEDEKANAVYLNTLDRYPDHVPSYCGLGTLLVRQGKIDAGIARLEEAHKLSPTDPVILNDIGMCWMLKAEHDKALDYFTQAAALAPDDTRYRANMALATGMMGRYDESYALYEQVMRPARAHYNLSVVAEARGDMAKADEEFRKAHELDSTIERKPRAKAQ